MADMLVGVMRSAGLLSGCPHRRCRHQHRRPAAAPALCRQRAALACRRFAAVCCSPQLLREVRVEYPFPFELHSLLAWLVRHGRHVRKLALKDGSGGEPESTIDVAVASCLAVAGAAGQLEELSLVYFSELHTEWLPALWSLRRLSLSGSRLRISAAIGGLSALGSLELCSDNIMFTAGARLPPTITRLHVEAGNDEEMPEQVSGTWLFAAVCCWCVTERMFRGGRCSPALPCLHCHPALQFTVLPQLQRLRLYNCVCTAESMAGLSSLSGSLTRLDVAYTQLPSSLSALTKLQHLCCWSPDHYFSGSDGSALRHLPNLTCLVRTGALSAWRCCQQNRG